jgi:CheY-like chemotaxis protein
VSLWRRGFHEGRLNVPSVLIVEGDAQARELARAFLMAEGHSVALAIDGAEALLRLGEAPPDVVITEIMVRKIDGLALCKRIKSDPATQHIKVVVFSIMAAMVRSREAGADDFLKKPLTQRKLVDVVAGVLGKPDAPPRREEP